MSVRENIISIARAEIGPGRVETYWRDVLGPGAQPPWPKHWCGAFALWCLHRAGLALDVHWKVGLGFLEVERLPKTREPKPGDIAYFDKPFQHHAVVEACTDGFLLTVDGNQPDVRPKRRIYPSGAIFYSIEPFIGRLNSDTDPAPPPAHLARDPHAMPVLRLGSSGWAVELLQQSLGGLKVDGAFGPKTGQAVEDFQRARMLKPDRVVGERTWTELLKESFE